MLTSPTPASWQDGPLASLTFDTDNCPDLAIEFLQKRLEARGMAGTFFCTRRYDSLRPPHEAALHPFLRDFQHLDKTLEPLSELCRAIPEAVGNRCHQLTCNGLLYTGLAEAGLLYDSAWPMCYSPGIAPVPLHTGIFQLPVFWLDSLYWLHGEKSLNPQPLRQSGLKIFLFHPVHLWHNATSLTCREIMALPYAERYRPELVAPGPGILHFFDRLLDLLQAEGIPCATCADIALAAKGQAA
jgi:hypothetical protein